MYYIFFFKFRFIYWYIPARQYVTYISYFLGTDSSRTVACKVLQRGIGLYRMGDMRDHYRILTCDPQIFNQVRALSIKL